MKIVIYLLSFPFTHFWGNSTSWVDDLGGNLTYEFPEKLCKSEV